MQRSLPFTLLFSLLAATCLLGGCFSRSDALSPIVSTDPPNGTVRRVDNLQVNGYALDDSGIAAIRVNNVDLLDAANFQDERGKKLVQFGFRPAAQNNRFVSTIVVEDTSGNVTTNNYELQVDDVPPDVTFEVTSLGENRLRVTGTASDNDLVEAISVAGQRVSFVAAQEKDFNLDVTVGEDATVRVEDRAGNVVTEPLNP